MGEEVCNLCFSDSFRIRTCFSLLASLSLFWHKSLYFEKYQSKNLGPLTKIRKKLAPLIFQAGFFQTPQNTLRAPIPY